MDREYVQFMGKYVEFCEAMAAAEEKKRKALLKDDIAQVESVLSSQQASLMTLETMEKQRVALQEREGWGDIPFTEILEKLSGQEREEMEGLYHRMSAALQNVKMQNEKAMQIAKLNLRLTNIEHAEQQAGVKSYAADKTVSSEAARGPLFETKI